MANEPGALVTPAGSPRFRSRITDDAGGAIESIASAARNRGCDGFVDARWDTTEAQPRQGDPAKMTSHCAILVEIA
jgi:hypothetical protein